MLRFALRALVYIFIASTASAALKIGVTGIQFTGREALMDLLSRPSLWVGVVFHGLGMVLWMLILRDHDFSFIFPVMSGLLYVAVILWGVVYFHETMSLTRMAGIGLIIVGTVIASRGGGGAPV